MDSQRSVKTFLEPNIEEKEMRRRRRELAMLTSSSTMASSLERSLELGAIHSDGLSDKEKQVRAVKNTIKGHRRTHSVSFFSQRHK